MSKQIEVQLIQVQAYGTVNSITRSWFVNTVEEAQVKLKDCYYQLLQKPEVDLDQKQILYPFDFTMKLKSGGKVFAKIIM